jgi:serine/threonine-protein kinase RsbW
MNGPARHLALAPRTGERSLLRLWLPAEPGSVPTARAVIRAFSDPHLHDPQRRSDLGLAVTEAATNVVRHAYPGASDRFQLSAVVEDARMVIGIRDCGVGFGSTRASHLDPGLGVGVRIMHQLADDCTVRSSAAGTTVTLGFLL